MKARRHPLQHAAQAFALTLLLSILAACAALGVPAPETFSEKVAAAQVTVTSTRVAATQLLNAGKISVQDAKNVQAAADAGNAGIDLAIQLSKTDPSAASAKLTSAMAVVTAVQVYLTAQGAKQ